MYRPNAPPDNANNQFDPAKIGNGGWLASKRKGNCYGK